MNKFIEMMNYLETFKEKSYQSISKINNNFKWCANITMYIYKSNCQAAKNTDRNISISVHHDLEMQNRKLLLWKPNQEVFGKLRACQFWQIDQSRASCWGDKGEFLQSQRCVR